MTPVRVGVIGCGKISDAYFHGCRAYEILEVAACADLVHERAVAKAALHQIRAASVRSLLEDPDIDLIVNLTIPATHAEMNRAALNAGKHVYCEKPFAIDPADGAAVLALASARGRLVGCAPDTFFGDGLQTARAALDAGVIGRPVAALGTMLCHGHEHWHPSPQFYYERGGGPMFDMGPYYLTTLVHFLGPVTAVSCSALATYASRTISSQPLAGTRIPVEIPTHYSAAVTFANGAAATLLMSFDTWPGPVLPPITLFGESGTLEVPDPNRFDGAVRLWKPGAEAPETVPSAHAAARSRGSGVADMAYSIARPGRPTRVDASIAQHVLEIMAGCDASAASRREVSVGSRCGRPARLPPGLAASRLDP